MKKNGLEISGKMKKSGVEISGNSEDCGVEISGKTEDSGVEISGKMKDWRETATFSGILKRASARLEENNVPDSEFDALQLFLYNFSMDRTEYLFRKDEKLQPSMTEKIPEFEAMIERRSQREPLQQIMGFQYFHGYKFSVNRDVLCPREDTDVLVRKVLEDYRGKRVPGLTGLDLCTGSGAIGISLAKEKIFKLLLLTDISDKALNTAHENLKLLEKEDSEIRLLKSDMFKEIGPWTDENAPGLFDIIVSNPPYIRSSVIDSLEPEVKSFEPRLALDGGEDGLLFYRIIAGEGKMYLKEGGRLYLEIGFDQGEELRRLLKDEGFINIEITKDFSGNDRVISAQKIKR